MESVSASMNKEGLCKWRICMYVSGEWRVVIEVVACSEWGVYVSHE